MTTRFVAKPHLAIDFDEVLFPLEESLAAYHNQVYATEFTAADLRKAYEYHLVWGGTRRQANAKVFDFRNSAFHAGTDPVAGAATALNRLAEHYRLTIITARGLRAQLATLSWIKNKLPADHIDNVIFTGNHYENDFLISKTQACHDNHVEYLIDDALRYLREAHQAGIKTIKFGQDPYDGKPIEKGMLKAANWQEVTDLLLKDTKP